MRARLALLDGDARPTVIDLSPDRPISIGRSRDNTVVLPREDQASRLHARVYFEDGCWLLRDFGLNGTRINESRVNQVAALADGAEIRIGAVRFRFVVPEPPPAGHPRPPAGPERGGDTMSTAGGGARFGAEELTALNQFVGAAVEARDQAELARLAVQALFYETGATLAGLFTLDPVDPVPKAIWPESGQVDEQLARQMTRRVHREHRLVWLAEDSVATIPAAGGTMPGPFADALGLPLKVGNKVWGAFHLYKASGFFSDRDRKFAEAVANFAANVFRGLRARRALEAETARLRSARSDGEELLGDSPVMVGLRAELGRAAGGSKPVLFLGEAGVGKELAALEAHRRGPRADGPFVSVRCGATALLEAEVFGYRRAAFSGADKDHAGSVALADDGTLFFDEVADLPAECQVKLLRLIEARTYRPVGAASDLRADVRVMAATSKVLAAEVKAGRFREDLAAALRVMEVTVPPLRSHPEDIPHLAQFFLDRLGAVCRREWALAPDAVRLLQERAWPGNVRQLKSVLGHVASAAATDLITAGDLQVLLGNSAG